MEFIGEAVTGASVALAGVQVIQIVVFTWPGRSHFLFFHIGNVTLCSSSRTVLYP